MELITRKTEGVLPLPDDFTGAIVVISVSGRPARLKVPKLQIAKATGGSGCKVHALGSGVFVDPHWIEHPEGSGKLRRTTRADLEGFDGVGWKDRRNNIIGIATPELVRKVEATPDTIEPGNPDDLCVMVVKDGSWAKADTVKAAMRMLSVRSLKGCQIGVVHRECSITDFGSISVSNAYVVDGRPILQEVSGFNGVTRTLDAAEEYAASLIAAAHA